MSPGAIVLFLLIGIAVVYIYSRDAVRAWYQFRGVRLVTCPESGTVASVAIDVAHAATTAFVENEAEIRLKQCSRWPTRGVCRGPCIPAMLSSGDNGRVQTIVERWYATQTCRFCGKPIAQAASVHHPPAFADAAGGTVEWSKLPSEQLPEVMASRHAVCWNCHVAESFRKQYPDLVVDRMRH